MSLHTEVETLIDALEDDWVAVELRRILKAHPVAALQWRTEYGVMMDRSQAIWNKYPSAEAAREFVNGFPDVAMSVVARQATDGQHTKWEKL